MQTVLLNTALDHRLLKGKHRKLRADFKVNLDLRVHRALSWLQRAEQESEDRDCAFVLLWIAFNAAYAEDIRDRGDERSSFESFFNRIVDLDRDLRLYNATWKRFAGPIRVLFDNPYVFQPFWNHQNGVAGFEDWEARLDRSRKRLQRALQELDTKVILSSLFDRLYVLRNQLIHGGATWNGAVNRAQVRDGAAILAYLVPLFIDLMMDHPEIEWPMPNYPVLEHKI